MNVERTAAWLSPIRKVYISYGVALAAVLLLLFGLNLGLQLFYDFQSVHAQLDLSFGERWSKQVAQLGMLLLIILVFSLVLAKCIGLISTVWVDPCFKSFTKRTALFLNGRGHAWVYYSVQLFFVLLLDVAPITFAIAFGLYSRSMNRAFQMLFCGLTLAAGIIVLLWWIGDILSNYKTLVGIAFRSSKLMYSVTTEPEVNNKNVELQESANREAMIATPRGDPAQPSAVDIEYDLFLNMDHTCCLDSVRLRRFEFRRSIIWKAVVLTLLFALVIAVGIWQSLLILWVGICLVACSGANMVFNFYTNSSAAKRLSRQYMRKSELENVIESSPFSIYFCVVFEQVLLHTPRIVLRGLQILFNAVWITITVCIVLKLTSAIAFMVIPLVLDLVIAALYIVRLHKYEKSASEENDSFFRKLSVFTTVFIVVAIVLAMLVLNFAFCGGIPGTLFLCLLIATSFIFFRQHDGNTGLPLVVFISLFLMVLGTVFLLGSIKITPNFKPHATSGVFVNASNPAAKYPVCDMTWHGFDILDYAYLSQLSYEIEPFLAKDLQVWFPDESFTVRHSENNTVTFVELYSQEKNLIIIAVRGTKIIADVIQDIDVWKEIMLLQTGSIFGPFLNFWPDSLVVKVINWVSYSEKALSDSSRFYYDTLFDYTDRVYQRCNPTNGTKLCDIVLTGHSLGGGIAKIVGSRLGVPAITFSSPGVYYSQAKLGVLGSNIDQTSVTIAPRGDAVPLVDQQAGLVQSIQCRHDNYIECHLIGNTILELIDSCGSGPLGRSYV